MPVRDKYADESTVEVDPELVAAWRGAEDAAARWKAHADALKAELLQRLAGHHAGTVAGVKVVTNRPTEGYATARLMEDYPDLTAHFLREKTETVLDVEAFGKRHPDTLEEYRIRSCRYVRPKIE